MRHYLVSYRNGQLHHEQVKPDYLSITGIGLVIGSVLITILSL